MEATRPRGAVRPGKSAPRAKDLSPPPVAPPYTPLPLPLQPDTAASAPAEEPLPSQPSIGAAVRADVPPSADTPVALPAIPAIRPDPADDVLPAPPAWQAPLPVIQPHPSGGAVQVLQPGAPAASPAERTEARRSIRDNVTNEAPRLVTQPRLYPALPAAPDALVAQAPPLTESEDEAELAVVAAVADRTEVVYDNPMLAEEIEAAASRGKGTAQLDRNPFYRLVLAARQAELDLLGTGARYRREEATAEQLRAEVWKSERRSDVFASRCPLHPNNPFELVVNYELAVVSQEVAARHKDALARAREAAVQDHTAHAFNSKFAWMQVTEYLDDVLAQSTFSRILPTSPVCTTPPSFRLDSDVDAARTCLDVLFAFAREENAYPQLSVFHTRLRECILRVGAMLIRVAAPADHRFLLGHAVQCPGSGAWFRPLLQFPEQWTLDTLNHFIAMLHVLLHPVSVESGPPGAVLSPLDEQPETDTDFVEDGAWTMVDRRVLPRLLLNEDSVEALFDQFPLGRAFEALLPLSAATIPFPEALRVYGASHQLLRLFSAGMRSFAHYRQVSGRLGHAVNVFIRRMSAFTDAMHSAPLTAAQRERLQIERDAVFVLATRMVLAGGPGQWRFLSGFRFDQIRVTAAWTIFHLLCRDDESAEAAPRGGPLMLTIDQWERQRLQHPEPRHRFAHSLAAESDAQFLLTALEVLGVAQGGHLAAAIVHEFFHLAYVARETRQILTKSLRDAIVDVVERHPRLLSRLFKAACAHLSYMGMAAAGLFRALPLKQWQLRSRDTDLLAELLQTPHDSPGFALAMQVLDGAEWGWAADPAGGTVSLMEAPPMGDGLFLGASVHRAVMLALARSYLCRPSRSAAVEAWYWTAAMRLRVHNSSGICLIQPCDLSSAPEVLDLRRNLESEQRSAFVAYIALQLCTVGHENTLFQEEGWPLLTLALRQRHPAGPVAVMRLLLDLMPGLAVQQKAGVASPPFTQLLSDLAAQPLGQTAQRQPLNECLAGVVCSHVATRTVPFITVAVPGDAHAMLRFWLAEIGRISDWSRSPLWRTVVNDMCSLGVLVDRTQELRQFLRCEAEAARNAPQPTGLLQRIARPLMSLFRDADGTGVTAYPWLSFHGLLEETVLDRDRYFSFASCLLDTGLQPLSAVCTMQGVTDLSSFAIYRWANHILLLDAMEPALPLFCQIFFTLFFYRDSRRDQFLGPPFFDRRRRGEYQLLRALVTKFEQLAVAWTARSRQGQPEYQATAIAFQLAPLFNAMALWLKDDTPNTLTGRMSALSPAHCAERLACAIQDDAVMNERLLWMDLVNRPAMADRAVRLLSIWGVRCLLPCNRMAVGGAADGALPAGFAPTPPAPQTPSNIGRVARPVSSVVPSEAFAPPIPAPPLPPSLPPPVLPAAGSAELDVLLESDKRRLVNAASEYSTRLAAAVASDAELCECLAMLYSNVRRQRRVEGHCPVAGCMHTAVHMFLVEEKSFSLAAQDRMTANRARMRDIVRMGEFPLDVCSAAVRLYRAIDRLVSASSTSTLPGVSEAGARWFYRLLELDTGTLRPYLPLRQLLADMIPRLLACFIRTNAAEALRALPMILADRERTEALAPMLEPLKAAGVFVEQYQVALSSVSQLPPEVAVIVLGRFDLPAWLAEDPIRSKRVSLLQSIGTALQTVRTTHPSWAVLHKHFQALYLYGFPEHYSDLLQLLMQGSRTGSLPPAVWWALHELPLVDLPVDILLQTAEFLNRFLWELRTPTTGGPTTLYDVWGKYVEPYLAFVGLLLQVPAVNTSGPGSAVQTLWQLVQAFFMPVVRSGPPRQLHAPWAPPMSEQAGATLLAVMQLLEQCQARDPGSMDAFWRILVDSLLLEPAPQVLSVLYTCLPRAPWRAWVVRPAALSEFLQLSAAGGHRFFFVMHVVCAVDWQQAIAALSAAERPGFMLKLLRLLTVLLHQQPLPVGQSFLSFIQRHGRELDWSPILPQQLEELMFGAAPLPLMKQLARPNWILAPTDAAVIDLDGLHAVSVQLLRSSTGCWDSSGQPVPFTQDNERKFRLYIGYVLSLMSLPASAVPLSGATAGTGLLLLPLRRCRIMFRSLLEDVQALTPNAPSDLVRSLFMGVLEPAHATDAPPPPALLAEYLAGLAEYAGHAAADKLLPLLSACAESVDTHRVLPSAEHIIGCYLQHNAHNPARWDELAAAMGPLIASQERVLRPAAVAEGRCLVLAVLLHARLRVARAQSLNEEDALAQWLRGWVQGVHVEEGRQGVVWAVWMPYLRLLVRLLCCAQTSSISDALFTFAERLIQISEDPREGLRAILFGSSATSYPPEFRLAARAIGVFVRTRWTEDRRFRMTADVRLTLQPDMVKQLASLSDTASRKPYSHVREAAMRLYEFVASPANAIPELPQLLLLVVNQLYPQYSWLNM